MKHGPSYMAFEISVRLRKHGGKFRSNVTSKTVLKYMFVNVPVTSQPIYSNNGYVKRCFNEYSGIYTSYNKSKYNS